MNSDKYRIFRKTCSIFSVWYIRNVLVCRSIWYMNESSLSLRISVHVVFIWTHILYEVLWPHGLAVNKPHSCQLCYASFHLWSFQQQLKFPLATPEQCAGWCGTCDLWSSPKRNNCKDSCMLNIVARTTHTQSTLEIDLTGHRYQTHHDILCMWSCTIMLGKCVHMSCSLNDQNDLILQLPQLPLVCFGALQKGGSNKPLLADCTLYTAFFRV
jgi:hypothetical protein